MKRPDPERAGTGSVGMARYLDTVYFGFSAVGTFATKGTGCDGAPLKITPDSGPQAFAGTQIPTKESGTAGHRTYAIDWTGRGTGPMQGETTTTTASGTLTEAP